ncbi:MAG: endonuclease III domain-containing protein [Candidatus Omnitrophota bacterium]|nr:endonuclease III domain-containing protein [Candidatus Omnitrophota bacterium]
MRKDLLARIYKRLFKTFGPRGWWPGQSPFEVMVGAVLTQNTAWTNVEKAIRNLKREKILTPARLDNIKISRLARLIRPAGYFNVKAKRLKSLVGFLFEEYKGDLRRMRKERINTLRPKLLGVHGIGPETCDSILLYALEKPVFVIDAYTKRIFSRCGVAKEDIPYEELQSLFMEDLPKSVSLYNEYHALIVQLGKDICRKDPKCGLCCIREFCKNKNFR